VVAELFGTDERQMQELQFEFFVPLEHAEAVMQATREVTKDWHLPAKSDPDGRPFANYTDIRVIRGDEHWMSATTSHHGGDTIAMAMGINKNGARVLDCNWFESRFVWKGSDVSFCFESAQRAVRSSPAG